MFVRAANPIWWLPDLTGQPLNDQYYAFFLTNTLPYIPQNVYRDPQGQTVWTGDVIQFFPNGTLPDNLYFDPNLVYRIEIRQGNSQADPLIYEINNFVPGEGASPSNNSLAILGTENQISNSQFSLINFVSPLTISSPGTYLIAPCWELVLTGSGSTTLTQLILAGNQDIVTDPPYSLRVDNNGWTQAYLRQRFQNNGAIWASGAITMSITARAQTVPETITLVYSPNSPGAPQQVATALLGTGDYQVVNGAIDLPASVNSTTSDQAYTDMIIQLPATGIVDITSVQAIGQTDPLPSSFDPASDIPSYQQEPQERIIDHIFHYYKQQLVTKPKKSLLTGWDFSLNPFQYITTTVTTVSAETSYICDQTILHQEAGSQLQSGQNAVAQRKNLLIKAVTSATATRMALIQYIDPATIRPFWSYILSAYARARIFTTQGTSVRLKCRLIYRASLPSTIGDTEPIASWSANSDPTFAAGWTAIAPLNDPAYVLPNAYATDEVSGENAYPAFSFDSFLMPDASNANMTLGIVLYTMDNLNSSSGNEDSVGFDRVSLKPGLFGSDAEAETYDESLRKCQYYYEQSYATGVLPGTNDINGIKNMSLPVITDGSSTACYPKRISFEFKQVKRTTSPIFTIFAPDGTSDNVSGGVNDQVGNVVQAAANISFSHWTLLSLSDSAVVYTPNGSNVAIYSAGSSHINYEGFIEFHYSVDARLGV